MQSLVTEDKKENAAIVGLFGLKFDGVAHVANGLLIAPFIRTNCSPAAKRLGFHRVRGGRFLIAFLGICHAPPARHEMSEVYQRGGKPWLESERFPVATFRLLDPTFPQMN